MKRFGPEFRQAIRIGAVKHNLSLSCHDLFPFRPHRRMAYLRDGGRSGNRRSDFAQPKSARPFWLPAPAFAAGNWYSIIPARRRNSFTLPGPKPAYWLLKNTNAPLTQPG